MNNQLPSPAVAPGGVDLILRAAEAHGRNSEPDHEVGDLQDALRAAWVLMNPAQRALLLRNLAEAITNELEVADPDAAVQACIQTEVEAVNAMAAKGAGGFFADLVVDFPGLINDEDVDGGDLVDWLNDRLPQAAALAIDEHADTQKPHITTQDSTASRKPRVLVYVSGGVAYTNCDPDVEVFIFDQDNADENDAPGAESAPAHFADLALSFDIPVRPGNDDAATAARPRGG